MSQQLTPIHVRHAAINEHNMSRRSSFHHLVPFAFPSERRGFGAAAGPTRGPVLAGSAVQTMLLFTTTELWNIYYLAKVSARKYGIRRQQRRGPGQAVGRGGIPTFSAGCLINVQIWSGVD